MSIKYYEITEQELIDIRAELPANTAFGFESFGSFYFDSTTVENIDKVHGSLLNLTFTHLYQMDKDTFLDTKESNSYETYVLQKQMNEDGFDVYEKIIGKIRSEGDLGTSLDSQVIPGYKLLTDVRMMLKDGLFEAAFRYWVTDIKTLGLLSAETEGFVDNLMEQLCLQYGIHQQVIDAIKGVPKGSL